MKPSLVVGLLLWPLFAQEAFLIPSTFNASVGERITVSISLGEAAIADTGIYTPRAAYNLVSPRLLNGQVVLDGSLKVAGTAILSLATKPRIVDRSRISIFAKALVDVETRDANRYRTLGLPLELVLSDDTHVMLLANGKALAGIEVSPLGRTAADGRVAFQNKPGIYKLTATKRLQAADPSIAEWDTSTATLTFEIH